jgi:hemerythrin-like domain-containing protein
MKATQQLRDEHEGVLVMLKVLDKVSQKLQAEASLNQDHFEGILEFLKVFVDKCHHGKEEDLLFPALEKAGIPREGPISVMLYEHTLGRSYVKAMSELFDQYKGGDRTRNVQIIKAVKEYVALLDAHIEKENGVLFVMADNVLSEEQQDELFEGFERIEEERIGPGTHEKLHGLIRELSSMYLG